MASQADELPSVARRMTAGKMLAEGASVAHVVEVLRMSPQTVERYKAILDEGGLDALRQMSIGGRPSALDDDARQWLAAALNDSARAHGFPTDAWTNARVRELLTTNFGVSFSRVYTWQLVSKLGLAHRLSKSTK
ncbi:helix-turn-helix domain-containing protein [Paraburkholderia sp. BCC1884]|uniref:helix-turn-helix domain-containing protein n=1 Tax=Paraburkholderia sp. BCC1884 TaxID=2562668 RepID=UPI001181FB6C|nr:helix-turn-helix domain-containing protein [Paraburkholderia sp. BCC1884]